MYKICFFVPASHAESVKSAVFLTGAGRIGSYEQCCWQSQGTGQFRPLSGSQPYVGEQDVLEYVEELKVEMVCDDEHVKAAISALRAAHPYEQPAYEVWKLAEIP